MYDLEDYQDIITQSYNLGITPSQYVQMLSKPCSICGKDKIILSKLNHSLNKQFKMATNAHLYCFINSKINSGLTITNLKLNYSIAHALQVDIETLIYIQQQTKINNETATITLFNSNLKMATFICKVKNNQIYSITENV